MQYLVPMAQGVCLAQGLRAGSQSWCAVAGILRCYKSSYMLHTHVLRWLSRGLPRQMGCPCSSPSCSHISKHGTKYCRYNTLKCRSHGLSPQLCILMTCGMVVQGLPDAQTPENVLTLIDSLQTQLLKSAERLGQVESQCADQAGECTLKLQTSTYAVS